MSSKIYVGNLPYTITESELTQLFTPYGKVASVEIIMDRETGHPRGFGFVTFVSEKSGPFAVGAKHGRKYLKRPLTVSIARPETVRPVEPKGAPHVDFGDDGMSFRGQERRSSGRNHGKAKGRDFSSARRDKEASRRGY